MATTYTITYRKTYRGKIYSYEIPACQNPLQAIDTFERIMSINRVRRVIVDKITATKGPRNVKKRKDHNTSNNDKRNKSVPSSDRNKANDDTRGIQFRT